MRVLVLGATGPTGRHLVTNLHAAGHTVSALVRRPRELTDLPADLTLHTGDATDPSDVQRAVAGQDAVLSTLGMGTSLKANGLFTAAATALVTAVAQTGGPNHLIWLSSFGVGPSYGASSRTQKLIYSTLLRSIYADKATADEIIRAGDSPWTIVLPTRLTDEPARGRYRAADRLAMRGNPTIARADVAAFMGDAMTDEQWLRRDVVLSD